MSEADPASQPRRGAAKPAPSAAFVLFGAFGDLTARLLVPALANLARDGLLDANTDFIGVDHNDVDDAAFAQSLHKFLEDDAGWQEVKDRLHYLKGDFEDAATYKALAKQIPGNAVFYLATSPRFFGPIIESLGQAGLLKEDKGFRRVVVEKPFGRDLASARALNDLILAQAGEDQIYRIDHFLGKETVQNLMVARFGNTLIEAIWNNRYIDHVQITVAETVGVGTRGSFYDGTGALRDMVPNHLFQIFALLAMEPPNSFDADAVHIEKTKALTAVIPADPANTVRGRYGAGTVDGKPVKPYAEEKDVDPAGTTETYVALKLEIDNWRWTGVPFYLRTGKALSARDTEIVVQFRDIPGGPFRASGAERPAPNRLIFQVQPNEGISLEFIAKRPGTTVVPAPVAMDFRYADAFDLGHRTGYETLLYDVLIGDQTLFSRAAEIEAGWRAVQPLLDAWDGGPPPEPYAAGSSGPDGAIALIARDGRRWHQLG